MKYDRKFILDSIKKLGNRYGTHEAFRDVVICCAYALANNVDFKDSREKEYLRVISKYTDEEKQLFPKILVSLFNEYATAETPTDILGDIYEKLNLTKKGAAQFFTPLSVCEMMAKVIIDKNGSKKSVEEHGYVSVSDPSCGSGRNIYAAYSELLENGIDNKDILLVGDDLDLTCCCMTYVQLSLMDANAIVHHQDSLTMDRYDTFYTMPFVMNKELQEKLSNKEKEIEEEIEI